MSFTEREQAIEEMLCKGVALKDLAEKMKITERTLQFYLSSILKKYKRAALK